MTLFAKMRLRNPSTISFFYMAKTAKRAAATAKAELYPSAPAPLVKTGMVV